MNFKKLNVTSILLLGGALNFCSPPIPNVTQQGGRDPSDNGRNDQLTEEGDSVFSGQVVLNWGDFEFQRRGLLSQGTLGFTELIADNFWGLFCFENNNPCRRASTEIRQEIGNNPVAIQGFQLNMAEPAGTVFELNAASVTTAEILFSGSTGRLTLSGKHTRQLVTGQTCNIAGENAVGLEVGTAGSERILTGLYLYDEGLLNVEGNVYNQIHLTSGRVWYSGLKPTPSLEPNLPFSFTFVPAAQAAEADFGKNSFQTSSSTGNKVSPKFGLDEEYANSQGINRFENHVVIGYCIQAQKRTGTVSRPAFLLSKSRTYTPVLEVKTNSSSSSN